MMTTKTINGVVRGGRIEPVGPLDAPEGTRVTISVPTLAGQHRSIRRGMFAKRDANGLSEQDMKDMKRIWEREWERSWDRLERS